MKLGNIVLLRGGGLLPLSYQNNTGGFPAYTNAVNQAATNWYWTPTPSDLYSVGGAANVTLSTFSSGAGYWAVTQIWANQTTCVWVFCWTNNNEIPTAPTTVRRASAPTGATTPLRRSRSTAPRWTA